MQKDLKTFGDDIQTLGTDIDLPMVEHIGTIHSRRAHSITWHYHAGTEVIFLLAGTAGYEFRKHQTIHVSGGHFLMIPREVEHRGVQNVRTPATLCGLLLSPDFCEGLGKTLLSAPLAQEELSWLRRSLARCGPVVCRFSSDLKLVLERLMKAQQCFETNRGNHLFRASLRVWVCACIVDAVGELKAPCSLVSHELVVAAEDYLKEHLTEHIRMPDLIKHIGLGPSRLFQLFKSSTGLTPNDYLVRLRVDKAKELLARPQQSVTDIAMATGFSSAQYFSGVFRKYAGQTPREYRLSTCRRIAA
jgi:AraC-like DNA-binding protein